MVEENYKLGLVGKYFHSFNKNGTVCWQGYIKQYIGDDYFLIHIYKSLDDVGYKIKIIKFSDMINFEFYDSSEEMIIIYKHKLKFIKPQEVNESESGPVLKILGAILKILPTSQTDLIKRLNDHYPHEYGLKKRTLEKYFALANKAVE